MRRFAQGLAAVAAVMGSVPASADDVTVAKVPAKHRRARCRQTFTVAMGERAARRVYAGTRDVPRHGLRVLGYIERCQRHPGDQARVRAFDRAERAAWWARRHPPPPMQTAIASVYDAAGGPIACGGNSYALGVAHRTLPCGTRLRICYSACVEAIVFDRGPFIASRDFDLSRAVQEAIGFPFGVGPIRYAIG